MNPCCCGGASQSLHITHRVISKHNPDFMHASTEEFDKTAKKREYSGVGYLAEELSPPARHLTSRSAGAFSLLLSCDIENWSAVKKKSRKLPCFWWTIRVGANRGDRCVWLVHNKSHPLFCSSSSSSSTFPWIMCGWKHFESSTGMADPTTINGWYTDILSHEPSNPMVIRL